MIHILITSHGGMAQGMIQSVKMLAGQQEHLECVTFDEEMGQDELDEQYADKLKDTSEHNQYLVLCDIKGGTPFNVVSRYSFQNEHVAVLYGMNLPILMEALIQCSNKALKLKELTDYLKRQAGGTIGFSEL